MGHIRLHKTNSYRSKFRYKRHNVIIKLFPSLNQYYHLNKKLTASLYVTILQQDPHDQFCRNLICHYSWQSIESIRKIFSVLVNI